MWSGKPDVYRALHAALIPVLPIAESTVRRVLLRGHRMSLPDSDVSVASLAERVGALLGSADRRVLVGVAGPPGAGKSTLAAAVAEQLGPQAVLVPQDGFHLAQRQLEQQGLADRKGAPETFDVHGFAELLRRLRTRGDTDVYVPYFDRSLEEPVAGGIRVRPDVRIVLTEGNYLLLDRFGWSDVHAQLDECWYLDPPDEVRVERLVRRHESYGQTPGDARAWVDSVDEVNAALVARSAPRAELRVREWH